MDDIVAITYFGSFLVLFFLGLIVGKIVENKHFRRLESEEEEHKDFLRSDIKKFYPDVDTSLTPAAIEAQVVIANDYFKMFAASLRNIFGGEVKSYETLIQRARREAVIRLIREAKSRGYDSICNLRFETSNITKGAEIMAYGTAYLRKSR